MSRKIDEIESWGTDAFEKGREAADAGAASLNDRNRLWWEALPMTYSDWESGDREPTTKADFAEVDAFYFGTNPYIDQTVPFQQFAGKRVMEIGCGAGSASCRFAAEGAMVTAIDITSKAVALTLRHASVFGLQTVNAIQADAEDLQVLEDASFDYVYSWGVMHHSSRPEVCFQQVCSKLAPGGTGLIMVYHKNSVRYWLKGLFYLIAKGKIFKGDNFQTVQRHYTDGYYHKHYTRTSLAKAMEEAGFIVDGIDVTHMSSRMVPFVPDGVRQWLKNRFGWLIVARVSKKS